MSPGEDRLLLLIKQGLIGETAHFEDVAQSWGEVLAATRELLTQPHDYATFVIDTGNGIERLAQEEVCAGDFNGDWTESGFNGFGRGEKITANRLWMPFLQLLDQLRERRRMRIVLCCHASVRSVKNPEGQDYDRIEPGLSKPAWGFTAKWADMILAGGIELAVKKDGKIARAKATGGEVRTLRTSANAACEAKNCHRLPAIIRLGSDPYKAFDLFRAAFPKAAPQPETKVNNGECEQDHSGGQADAGPGEPDVSERGESD